MIKACNIDLEDKEANRRVHRSGDQIHRQRAHTACDPPTPKSQIHQSLRNPRHLRSNYTNDPQTPRPQLH